MVSGPAEPVFVWESDRCAQWDIPDTPARAWRDAEGRVRLIAGAEVNRAAIGPDLGTLAHDCAVLHQGAGRDDPGAYDDRAWIAAVFTRDGRQVEALAHVEYHGHLRPERCPVADYLACWRNAVVQLASEDGGRSFARRAGAADLVAALPYRYTGDAGRRTGYFNPSNIIRRGGHLYVFVFAEAYRAQKRGACLLRRPVAGGPEDWRAWDGTDFAIRFVDPYREDVADPAAHVCEPVAGLASTVSSVVRHTPSGRYLAVTAAARPGPGGRERSGIYWTVSDDLVTWSAPVLLLKAPLLWRRDCAGPTAYAYPSLLDAADTSPILENVGETFWLYLVAMRVEAGCTIGPRRDLIRFPISWPRG